MSESDTTMVRDESEAEGEMVPDSSTPVTTVSSEARLSEVESDLPSDKSGSARIVNFLSFESGGVEYAYVRFEPTHEDKVEYYFPLADGIPNDLDALLTYLDTNLSSAPTTAIGRTVPAFTMGGDWHILIPPKGIKESELRSLLVWKERFRAANQTTLKRAASVALLALCLVGTTLAIGALAPMIGGGLTAVLLFALGGTATALTKSGHVL